MDSRFVERDAEALVARYADGGVNRDLALRVYTTRLLGQDPRLVLHGGGNTSVKTTVPDLLGEDDGVLCVKGTGWDMGVIEPRRHAGGAARAAAQAARARRAERRGDGALPARQPDRSDGAQSVGRDAAARLRAAQVRRPHPRDRDPEPHRPAGRREDLRRGVRRPHGHRALHHAGLRAGEEIRRGVRGEPRRRRPDPAQARHLHLRRERARGLRAHDRDGDARRSAAAAEPQVRVRHRAAAAARGRARRPSRRSCAAPAACRTRRTKAPGGG